MLHCNFLGYELFVVLDMLFIWWSLCTLEGFGVKKQLVTDFLGDGSFL